MTRHERESSRMGANRLVFPECHEHGLRAGRIHAFAEEGQLLLGLDDVAHRADETIVRAPRFQLGCRRTSLG